MRRKGRPESLRMNLIAANSQTALERLRPSAWVKSPDTRERLCNMPTGMVISGVGLCASRTVVSFAMGFVDWDATTFGQAGPISSGKRPGTQPVGETSTAFCALDASIQELSRIYSEMTHTPSEKRLEKWEEIERDLGKFIPQHQNLIRLHETVVDNIPQQRRPYIPTSAIDAGTVVQLKKERADAFEKLRKTIPLPRNTPQEIRYPVAPTKLTDLFEMSYLLPGRHGWLLVASEVHLKFYLSTPCFEIVVENLEDNKLYYGVYKASRLPGQAMSGLEFSHLSQNIGPEILNCEPAIEDVLLQAKKYIAEVISHADKETPAYFEVFGNLSHSRITIPCLFLQCLEQPARLSLGQLSENVVETDAESFSQSRTLKEPDCLPQLQPVWGVIDDVENKHCHYKKPAYDDPSQELPIPAPDQQIQSAVLQPILDNNHSIVDRRALPTDKSIEHCHESIDWAPVYYLQNQENCWRGPSAETTNRTRTRETTARSFRKSL
ncbi:hypothetical protein BDZ97DRAFT_1916106 [Flammula alnicola]|nr:hypothetical protein BDZ97DRAFT_1916106 [Flammula alnicola]